MRELTLDELVTLGDAANKILWYNRTKQIAEETLKALGVTSPVKEWSIDGDWEYDDEGSTLFCATGMSITAQDGTYHDWREREDVDEDDIFSEALGQYRLERWQATSFTVEHQIQASKYFYLPMTPPKALPKVYVDERT